MSRIGASGCDEKGDKTGAFCIFMFPAMMIGRMIRAGGFLAKGSTTLEME
jgi:hypothetical protein